MSPATRAWLGQLCWPIQELTAGEQPTTAATLEDLPGRASKLKRFARTPGALGWWRLHKKVTGPSPATCSGGGRRRYMAQSSHRTPINSIKSPRGPVTHLDAPQMLAGVTNAPRRPQPHRFRRGAAGKNVGFPTTPAFPPRFSPR
jgi:hypothetical protein